jgi:hypothetical protein
VASWPNLNILRGNLLGRTVGDRRDPNRAPPEYKSEGLLLERTFSVEKYSETDVKLNLD